MKKNFRSLAALFFLLAMLHGAAAAAASPESRWNDNSLAMRRLAETNEIFQKYAAQYHFDGLMLAALGYQESKLDPHARSPAGYVGLMQIMPSTARRLGFPDVRGADANVHAAAKYMDAILTRYFSDAHFDNRNRFLFGVASYNAGPITIVQFRREAQEKGYNPDIWFNNVERVAAGHTVEYVRSVNGYYLAFKRALVKDAERGSNE